MYRWPLPRTMDQDQYPHRVVYYLIDEAIAAVRGQFARSGDLTDMAEHWEGGELGDRVAEKLIDAQGSGRISCGEISPYLTAIPFGLRRSGDLHA